MRSADWKSYDMRTLLYIPIVHSQSDMGSFSESIRKITLQKLGARAWHRKIKAIDRFWSTVEDTLHRLPIVYGQTRLYQDGIPVCGRELDIVKELAGQGSLNHQLLLRLIEKGATIMGTESPELLVEEYQLTHLMLLAGELREANRIEVMQKGARDLLLAKRDAFIAERIDQTLPDGETGILFMGMLHNLAGSLPADIQVRYPLQHPSEKRENGKA